MGLTSTLVREEQKKAYDPLILGKDLSYERKEEIQAKSCSCPCPKKLFPAYAAGYVLFSPIF